MSKNIVRLAKEFVVVFNEMVIARCTDFSLSLGDNKVDITSFDSEGFEEHVRDNKNWSVSFGSMVSRDYGTGGATGLGSGVFMNLFDHWATSASDYPSEIKIGDVDQEAPAGPTGTRYDYFEGKGTITMDVDGSVGDKATYSGTIQGSGSLKRPVTTSKNT